MGAIRNLNWTQLISAFIVCGLGRGLRSNARALDEVGSLLVSPSLQDYEVRSHRHCRRFSSARATTKDLPTP